MPRKTSAAVADAQNALPCFVAYYRVSTERQGVSQLGIEAQKAMVAKTVAAAGGTLSHEFEEHESGRRSDRPQLADALDACRRLGATLIVAKIDRLARNARFLLSIAEGAGDAGVMFCDLPLLPPGPMGKFFLTLMAAVAELESGLISERTKSALAAAKARGKKLGNPNLNANAGSIAAARKRRARSKAREVAPYIAAARRAGCRTLTEIAAALTARGVPTPSGKPYWLPEQVRRIEQYSQPRARG